MSITEVPRVPNGTLCADPKASCARSQPGTNAIRGRKDRNSQKSQKSGLRFYAPPPPPKPVVAAKSLTGDVMSFVEFLFDEDCRDICRVLFGEGTSTEQMLAEFRKATATYYYGHRRARRGQLARNPGMLDVRKAAGKKSLRQFVHLAYRGEPLATAIDYALLEFSRCFLGECECDDIRWLHSHAAFDDRDKQLRYVLRNDFGLTGPSASNKLQIPIGMLDCVDLLTRQLHLERP